MSSVNLVPLGNVLERVKRPLKLDDQAAYRTLGVRWYGDGAFTKAPLLGREIAAAKLNAVEPGDVVYSKLFAWKGSFGTVKDEHAGAVASNEFPTFRTTESLLPEFFELWASNETVWDEADSRSAGSTANSRNRLSEEEFLEMEIPLPPVGAQQEAVSKVRALDREAVAAHREAGALRELASALLREAVVEEAVTSRPLSELAALDLEKVDVDPTESYRIAGVKIAGEGLFSRGEVSGAATNYPKLIRLRTQQLVYRKLTAWEGPITVVTDEYEGHFVSPEFPTLSLDLDQVDPDVLRLLCRSPAFHLEMKALSTGTAERRGRIKPEELLEIEIDLPDIAAQRRIALLCQLADALEQHSAAARRLQRVVKRELIEALG